MAHSTHKTDSLFRHKLENLEVAPKATSWDAVKGQIQQEKAAYFPIWRVAASIVILLTIGLVVYNYTRQPEQQLLSSNDHPTEKTKTAPASEPEKVEELKAVEKKVEVKAPIKQTVAPKVEIKEQVKPAPKPTPKSDTELNQFSFITLERIEEKPLDVTLPVNLKTEPKAETQKESTTIKITYIASETKTSESEDLAGKFSKVISKAQQMSPGELLADIRDAKDHLLRRN